MNDILIKRETKKIIDIFFKNNYTLEEKKLFINAKKKIAEQMNDKISLELAKSQIEEKNIEILNRTIMQLKVARENPRRWNTNK